MKQLLPRSRKIFKFHFELLSRETFTVLPFSY